MGGFEALRQAQDEGKALGPILAKDVVFSDQKASDETALALVLQDAMLGVQYLQSKALTNDWNTQDDLFRCYVPAKSWPNSNTPRANLSMPVILETVESLLPQTHLSFFSEEQPFQLDPKGKTSAEAARAISKLVMWAIKCSGFKEELRKTQKSCMLYGQGILKWGWEQVTCRKKKYKMHEDGENVVQSVSEEEISQPTCEWVDLRNIIVAPNTRSHDIRTSPYRVYQKFIPAVELDKMRDDATYSNIPTRSELAMILADQLSTTKDTLAGTKQITWREYQAALQTDKNSADPLKQNLELLEYETDDRIITVLERCIVIRNEPNEDACCHYLSCSFIDVLNSFYGFGVAKLLEGEQRLQTGAANAWVDSAALTLNPTWQRKNGMGAQSQNITVAPGKVVNESGELVQLEVRSVGAEAMEMIQASEARAARRVGANFGQDMPNQAMRTAEGVQAFTSGVQVKTQYFVDIFAGQVFIPLILAFIEMCKDNLTPQQIKGILSDEDAQAFQGSILDVYNGQYAVDVLSSTKLAGRRAMQAMIPLMLQMLGQPAIVQLLNVQGKKFDFVEFFEEVFAISGWPAADLIVDMTPEDTQRMQQSNPAVVNAQAKQQQAGQKQQNDLEKIQATGEARAGVAVVKHALDSSAAEHKQNMEIQAMAKPLANQPQQ